MERKWRVAASTACLIGMLTSLAPVSAQQPAAPKAPAAAATPAKPVSARHQPEEVDAGQIELNGNHTVNLDREGVVHGRISLLDPRTGRPTPVENAIVSFVQNGRLVTQVRPDSNGSFSARLQPGVYSVIANAPAGYGAFAIVVRPYDPTAQDPQELSLDGTLIPPADAAAAANAVPPGAFGPGGPPFGGPPFGGVGGGGTMGGGGGFTGGGGGGTGGGLNSLLGLAPLAALAALAGNDDDSGAVVTAPVSPTAP